MCKWGKTERVRVKIAAELSHTGKTRWAVKGIDSCIAPIVNSLQKAGIDMYSSCCGHGEYKGEIELKDHRRLQMQTTQKLCKKACKKCWQENGWPWIKENDKFWDDLGYVWCIGADWGYKLHVSDLIPNNCLYKLEHAVLE